MSTLFERIKLLMPVIYPHPLKKIVRYHQEDCWYCTYCGKYWGDDGPVPSCLPTTPDEEFS